MYVVCFVLQLVGYIILYRYETWSDIEGVHRHSKHTLRLCYKNQSVNSV